MLLLRSDCSEPAVSLVQDDAKEQEPSGMWPFIIGGWDKVECLQNGPYNDKKWDSHEKMIFFGFRAGLRGEVKK